VVDVERVVATTWFLRKGPALILRIRAGGRTYRTRYGEVDSAQRLLGQLAEHGVPITEQIRHNI
jgi:hypothetical protein